MAESVSYAIGGFVVVSIAAPSNVAVYEREPQRPWSGIGVVTIRKGSCVKVYPPAALKSCKMYCSPTGSGTCCIVVKLGSMQGFFIVRMKVAEPYTGVSLPASPVTVTM